MSAVVATASDSASEASAGLVSFSHKGNTTLADAEKAQRRVWRMQRGVLAAARCVHNALVAEGVKFRAALVTFTYRPDVEWAPGQIGAAIRHYRQWCKRRGFKFRAVWVMELHASGRPHYHLVFWMPRGITPPLPDKQGWWPHGKTNAKWARSPVGYIAKYASKGTEGVIPKGARLWAAVGLSVEERAQVQWAVAPRWLRRMTSHVEGVKRVVRKTKRSWSDVFNGRNPYAGWFADVPECPDLVERLWLCMRSGFTFESPYECEGFSSSGLVLRPRQNPRCWSSEGEQFTYQPKVEIQA